MVVNIVPTKININNYTNAFEFIYSKAKSYNLISTEFNNHYFTTDVK